MTRSTLLLKLHIIIALCLVFAPPPALAIDSETTFGAELPVQTGGIRFVGEASPGALVTFLRNGTIIGTQVASPASLFDKSFPSEVLGDATYAIYANDASNRQTRTLSFDVTILPTQTTVISGILLPPTLVVNRIPIKRPQSQATLGTSRQSATITNFYYGDKYGDSIAVQGPTDANGNWSIGAGQTLHLGHYTANALVNTVGGNQSLLTDNISFQVLLSADLNDDGRVNLTDFSILMFFYNQNTNRPADINDDGRVNLTDFSILLFFWTG